jgi:hypothetical protein
MTRMGRSLALLLGLGASSVFATLLAQALPTVYFNHATIILPPAGYMALLQSTFLRNEFSGFVEQNAGIHLFGQNTYLEFFKAGPLSLVGTAIAGEVGFNMWIDDRSQLPLLRDRVEAERGATLPINTARNGQNLPSYDYVTPQGGLANFFGGPGMIVATVLKGYYPDGITRERRIGNRFIPERNLHDVTSFTLTANEAERRQLIQDFRAYSYSIGVDGEKQVVAGPGVTFSLIPARPNAPRMLVIDMSTNRSGNKEQAYNLGDAGELRIQGSTARWSLTFPGNQVVSDRH